ncbi:MAG TPA: hypothetical protein VFR20_00245 [Burkholderiaceae bacterium]|nr:hypothetical protein [Burkholderiaceae bacterium]
MSIGGPSALGTLLVQRLDAVLGTTLSQQTNLISGARPDAVSQPADADKPEPGRDQLVRHPRESVDRSQGRIQGDSRSAIEKPTSTSQRQDPTGRLATDVESTTSAPTRLGFAARTILALLAEFPDQAPPVATDTALFDPAEARNGPHASAAGSGVATGSTTGPKAASTPGSGSTTALGTRGAAPGAHPASETGSAPHPSPEGRVTGTGKSDEAISTPTGMAPALARALNRAVEQSGLFYESHLADLAFGRRDANAVSAEPQARLPPSANDASTGSSGAAKAVASSAAPPQPGATPSSAAQIPGMPSLAGHPPSAAPAMSSPMVVQATAFGLPTEAHLLVRQQLETLANQAFAWQGPAWPGAPMHWTVERHQHSTPHDDTDTPAYWATHVRITLPRLGLVDASLTLLAGSRIAVRLGTHDGSPTLEGHVADLRSRLLAAGLAPGQIIIDSHASRSGQRSRP